MDRSVSERLEAPHRSGVRAWRQRALAAALALLAVAAASPPEEDPAAAKPGASEILDTAIKAQGMPPSRDPAADLPRALHAKVHLDYKDAQGNVISVDAERKYLGAKGGPGRIWTRITPTSSKERETILAFDGERPWFWSKERGIRLLTEPGMEHDRKVLEEDLESTELLTRAILLRNLPSQLKDLKRLPDESGYGREAWVIEGRGEIVRAAAKKPFRLRLWIDRAPGPEQGWLLGARVMIEGEPPLQICFQKPERRDGVVVPGKIELYWNDEPQPRQTLYVESLELAPKLDPSEFEPPRAP